MNNPNNFSDDESTGHLTGKPWTPEEVEAAVQDYFHMLQKNGVRFI
jgi:hypothetical protein